MSQLLTIFITPEERSSAVLALAATVLDLSKAINSDQFDPTRRNEIFWRCQLQNLSSLLHLLNDAEALL